MQCLSLGTIDVGSTFPDRKIKSPTQRWLTKHKVNHSKEERSAYKRKSFITRHTIVAFECTYGAGKNRVQLVENLRVLAIFSKHYSKRFCVKEEKIE